ncbi:hypothetical protein ACIBEA_10215 [Streptomyces sp. NPDC051555]|uniref:hypothetical protein n=1 Tax=Streptomyces sp. NPDC051555 TaxID=3365657 RepID=UPI0037B33B9E
MESPVTGRYVEETRRPDSELRTLTARAAVPAAYAKTYGHVLLPRPVFVSEREISAFADDLAALFRILVSLPERCYDGDLDRYGAAIGLPPELCEVMREGAGGDPLLYARADAFHDGTGFRLLELNVGSELGGIDSAQLNRAFLDVPAFRAFAERHRLGHTDTMAELVTELYAAAAARTGSGPVTGAPAVALLEAPGALGEHDGVFLSIQEDLRGHGIDLQLGEVQELTEGPDGRLNLHGRPLDVILRFFAAGQIAGDPTARAALSLVNRAHAQGRTALFTPLEGALFTSKAALGLVHRPAVRAALTGAELELIDRVLPRTWVLGAEGCEDALEHARTHRASLVLKPGIGYSADGVVIGRDVDDAAWAAALEATALRDYVAQELVVPALEPALDPDTGVIGEWVANWGIFVTPRGYGGAFVRALQPRDGSVITYANPGTRGTCVFTHPEDEETLA